MRWPWSRAKPEPDLIAPGTTEAEAQENLARVGTDERDTADVALARTVPEPGANGAASA
jgi:hypothetical protein